MPLLTFAGADAQKIRGRLSWQLWLRQRVVTYRAIGKTFQTLRGMERAWPGVARHAFLAGKTHILCRRGRIMICEYPILEAIT